MIYAKENQSFGLPISAQIESSCPELSSQSVQIQPVSAPLPEPVHINKLSKLDICPEEKNPLIHHPLLTLNHCAQNCLSQSAGTQPICAVLSELVKINSNHPESFTCQNIKPSASITELAGIKSEGPADRLVDKLDTITRDCEGQYQHGLFKIWIRILRFTLLIEHETDTTFCINLSASMEEVTVM